MRISGDDELSAISLSRALFARLSSWPVVSSCPLVAELTTRRATAFALSLALPQSRARLASSLLRDALDTPPLVGQISAPGKLARSLPAARQACAGTMRARCKRHARSRVATRKRKSRKRKRISGAPSSGALVASRFELASYSKLACRRQLTAAK